MAPGSLEIPIIDFSRFLQPSSHDEPLQVADAIVSAFKGAGFIYLVNHGIQQHAVSGLFAQVRRVFFPPKSPTRSLSFTMALQSSRFFSLPIDKKVRALGTP